MEWGIHGYPSVALCPRPQLLPEYRVQSGNRIPLYLVQHFSLVEPQPASELWLVQSMSDD